MLRNTFQQGFVSVFCSSKAEGIKALQLWRVLQETEGNVGFVEDEVIGHVLQLKQGKGAGSNISTTRIELPGDVNEALGIKLGHLILQVRPLDLKAHWSVEVGIVDAGGVNRVMRVSNYVEETRVMPSMCHVPLLLEPGRWQSVSLDLAKLCETAYGTQFKECNYVVVHANIRLKRIYFAESAQLEMPYEFQLRHV